MSAGQLTLMGCGDVGPVHEPIESYSVLARPVLATADVRFAQVERVYSERGTIQLHAGVGHSRVKPHMAQVFSDCGFNVVSLASNHAMDWGIEALMDSLEEFDRRGIRVIGAGENLAAARKPAIMEANGVKVAMLAYCSILNEGYNARQDRPGVAPLRVHTYYEAHENQPGVPPHVVTVPWKEDLAAIVEDVKAARQKADSVVVSLHWGIHHVPRMIAEYQPIVAEAIFDAGADMILGHHAHIPKAVEAFGKRVCFYSLSNFIMSAKEKTPEQAAIWEKRHGAKLDPDYPRLPYGSDAKRSMIAKGVFTKAGIQRTSFLPVIIDRQLRPEPIPRGDARFDDAVAYWEWASEDYNHKFTVEGNEVVVTPA
jgi:poly-gamma-glutamate capsule biosynthesis protein CapA/YwtB (metallophosphatase superfamily)